MPTVKGHIYGNVKTLQGYADLGHLISNIYLLPHVHAEITLSSDIMVLCIPQFPLKILLSAAKLEPLLSQPSSIDLPAGTYHYLSQQGSDIYH